MAFYSRSQCNVAVADNLIEYLPRCGESPKWISKRLQNTKPILIYADKCKHEFKKNT